MSVNLCTYGADQLYSERGTWLVTSCMTWLGIAFIGRQYSAALLFAYTWQSTELFLLRVHDALLREGSSAALWLATSGPIGWLIPAAIDDSKVCVTSAESSLIYDPLLFCASMLAVTPLFW